MITANFTSPTLRRLARKMQDGGVIRWDGFGFNLHHRGQKLAVCLADFDSLFCTGLMSRHYDARPGWRFQGEVA